MKKIEYEFLLKKLRKLFKGKGSSWSKGSIILPLAQQVVNIGKLVDLFILSSNHINAPQLEHLKFILPKVWRFNPSEIHG